VTLLADPLLTLEAAVSASALDIDAATSGTGNVSTSGEYAAAVSWGLISGQLRGRIPYPVPFDLQAVALSVGVRWATVLESSGTASIQGA
jgi:hypothetical protein